jgi:hypothetical protein
VGGDWHKERVKEDKYGGGIMYSCMKPVEIILRESMRENHGGGESK